MLGLYLEQEIDGKKSNDENANYSKNFNRNANISVYTPNINQNRTYFDSDKIVTERIKLDIENLKERKEELHQIMK
jgi:hypothetical protein